MRNLFFAICIFILSLSGYSQTDKLPQPDAEDWANLKTTAMQLKEGYGYLINNSTEQLTEYQRILKESSTDIKSYFPHAGAPGSNFQSYLGDLKTTIDIYTMQISNGKKAIANLTLINNELKLMTPADRTREKFLILRRKVKVWQLQYQFDNEMRYNNVGRATGAVTLSIENRLAALKANPPETIPVKPQPKELNLDWHTLPRLDGSTTAQPLSTLIICRALGLSAVWQYRSIYDRNSAEDSPERILIPQCSGSPLPSDSNIYNYYDSAGTAFPGLRLSLTLTGTNNAYRNLILGTSDFIIVARPPSADEIKLAAEKKIELDSQIIAYDAFIFVLNSANPVKSLTVKQIQEIYQDNVLRWSEVGGSKDKMIAFQREKNSGSQETMQEIVMKNITMAPPIEQLIGQGMGGPYNRLNQEKNGISYTFYYYQTVQSPVNQSRIQMPENKKNTPPIKICAINGIMPNPETIQNRTYPFVTPVYAIIRKDIDKNHPATRLRNWLLTPEGQELIKESGYVKLPEKETADKNNAAGEN